MKKKNTYLEWQTSKTLANKEHIQENVFLSLNIEENVCQMKKRERERSNFLFRIRKLRKDFDM
jgi:hypothetical protein